MSLDRVDPVPKWGAEKVKPKSKDLPDMGGQLTGAAASYGMILQSAQELAEKTEPTFTLVSFEVGGLESELVDPGRGQTIELGFGRVDASERLKKGSDIIVIRYASSGLVSDWRKAKVDMMAITRPICPAAKAISLAGGASASLSRASDDLRQVWIVVPKKGKPVRLDSETCAILGQR
jgi:hypothetical protein